MTKEVKPAPATVATTVVPPPKAQPAPGATTPAPAVSNADAVKERILALAVEKTGYPVDMLDLDLDLEADLGVDTVKQAEIFASIREMYNIPRDENRKLRDYPTLAHVISFVFEKRPDLAAAGTATPQQPVVKQPAKEAAAPVAAAAVVAAPSAAVAETKPTPAPTHAAVQRIGRGTPSCVGRRENRVPERDARP